MNKTIMIVVGSLVAVAGATIGGIFGVKHHKAKKNAPKIVEANFTEHKE